MKKLLFIRYKKTEAIPEGGDRATQRNLNAMANYLGIENIHTYIIHDKELKTADYFKKSWMDYVSGFYNFLKNYYYGITGSRLNEIISLANNYDYVFIDRSVFGVIAKKLKENGYQGRIITFFHNIEVLYFGAKIPKFNLSRGLILRCANANDNYSCRYSDIVIALNQRDEAELIQRYNRKADVIAPISLKDNYKRNERDSRITSEKPSCLFLGAYFKANNDGITWFIKEVYPHVNINLRIVGKGMDQLANDISIPSEVEVFSSVPDLSTFFNEADIMILPIFAGSGMKVKTCESLMYGKNIIGTTEAFEGYDIEYDRVGGCCNSKDEFIAKIEEFETTPRPVFNEYSRTVYLEKYSEEAVVGNFRKIVE